MPQMQDQHNGEWFLMGFHDATGNVYYGSDQEIVNTMAMTEYARDLSPVEYKENVALRAHYLGVEIEYHDASSFLDALERAGLGYRFTKSNPDHEHMVVEWEWDPSLAKPKMRNQKFPKL